MPSTADHIRVGCSQVYDGVEDQVNVLHFRIDTLPTPNTDLTVMNDLAVFISQAFNDIEGLIVNNVQPELLSFYNLSADAPMGQRVWGASYTGGTASGESLPLHDTCLVLFPTNIKRCTGRIYLPTFSEATQDGGGFASGTITSVENFGSTLMSGYTGPTSGGEYSFGVYRRSTGGFILPTSVRVSPLMAVQRRRKRGRGS